MGIEQPRRTGADAPSASNSAATEAAAAPPLRSMNSQEFVQRLKGVCDAGHRENPSSESRYAFFLGAGCSVSSGIPAAGALVRDSWIPRLCRIQAPDRRDYAAFAKERFDGYDPERASSFYGPLIDALFITPNDRQREIEQLCEGKFPGFGYAALAKLVAHKSTAFNVVLTTNFDDLMADALYLYTEARPLVIHHESLAAFIRPTRMRPLVVKLHGDSRLSPKNTREETGELGGNLAKQIAMLLNDRGLVFMGYGGADASILKLLGELPEEALPSGVFWLSPCEPAGAVRRWLLERKGVWVQIADFDEFMLRAYAVFDMKHPSKAEFDKMFGKYYETFGKMAGKVQAPNTGAPPDHTLVAHLAGARRDLPQDYKGVALGESLAAEEPAEAQRVLEAVARTPGTSARAQLSAARALINKLFKYNEAVTAYESALKLMIDEEGLESEGAARVNAELARAQWLVGDLAGAEDAIQQAIAWGEAQSPRDEDSLANWYSTRASIRRNRGLTKEAAEDIERSIAWSEGQSPRDELGLAIDYSARAWIRHDRGQLKAADEDITRSIAWQEAQSPRNELGLAISYSTRASIRQERGLFEEAEKDIAKSIAWEEAQSPRDERGLAICYAVRASIHLGKGLLEEAEADMARSVTWFRRHQPQNHRLMAVSLREQARIFAHAAKWEAAEASIDEAVPHHEEAFGPDHEWTKKARAWQTTIHGRQVPPRWIDTVVGSPLGSTEGH